MTMSTVAVIALLIVGWALIAGAVSRYDLTGPMVFTAAGYLLANPHWGPLHVNVEAGSVHSMVEITLALVLFSDAARVNIHELRAQIGLPVRLLCIGLPLTVLAGSLVAEGLLTNLPWALAVFVGAALAPTDAALSAEVIGDEELPLSLRRALNVESGLNDGIVTPIVTVAVAAAAGELGRVSGTGIHEAAKALRDLGIGALVGVALGATGAVLIRWAVRHGTVARGGQRLASLALAIGAFTVASSFHANGFIAAFVAGAAFSAAIGREPADLDQVLELPELGGELLALVVWFLFGAGLLPVALGHLDVPIVCYALLSLTLIRGVPVVVGLVGSRLDRVTVAFVAWFGPRGLASVVFGLLAIEELGDTSVAVQRATATVAVTVFLSVVLHGITVVPGARQYLRREHGRGLPADGPRARGSLDQIGDFP